MNMRKNGMTSNGARWRVVAWRDSSGARNYTLIQEYMRNGKVTEDKRFPFNEVDFNSLFIKIATAIAER